MFKRIKVMDVELTEPLRPINGLAGYSRVQILFRWNGVPVGTSRIPVEGDGCRISRIASAILNEYAFAIAQRSLRTALNNGAPVRDWTLAELLKIRPRNSTAKPPTVTVAVCTRDRPENLSRCLSALQALDLPPLEILVIDNAPRTSQTKTLVEQTFPQVRYFLEPRPGLNWARNRAIIEARGEILAYTDDDVIVDRLWTKNLATIFAENPDVMAVTGLVVPYEMETEAQFLFEEYGGFGRGFDRKWYRASESERRRLARQHAGAGKFGTGANMSYRRSIFSDIGIFDPALDVGTRTQGGGDLDMFFRVLKHGHTLVYEPAALVRHRHRRELGKLETQIVSNGIGLYSCWVRQAVAYPEERMGLAELGLWWFCFWNVRRMFLALFKPGLFPRKFIWGELCGCFVGLFRYQKARQEAEAILAQFGPQTASETCINPSLITQKIRAGIAIRTLDIGAGLLPIDDVAEYFQTRVFVTCHGKALGALTIENRYLPISLGRLSDEIAGQLGTEIFFPQNFGSAEMLLFRILGELRDYLSTVGQIDPVAKLSDGISVSIVVATRDRPKDLRRCLAALTSQRTNRPIEILVVDNNPASGLTAPVVAEFPVAQLIAETRPGPSYARNAGFVSSSGEVIVTTDDDVIAPEHWLESLIAPLVRNDVMMVTGNVFPIELETDSQNQFENYGGLGRGFETREFGREWFDSFKRKAVPTWEIGATANAAIRSSVLSDPSVGLFDESLGPGMPTGCSEDTHFFYKIIKAGHTIVYEPSAFVWHKHRVDENALAAQIFRYSKGHVAYHLATVLDHGDGRGLVRILAELPLYHLRQFGQLLRGQHNRSFKTVLLEIAGNFLGPWALWAARRRVKVLGESSPYIAPELRILPKTADESGVMTRSADAVSESIEPREVIAK